MEADQYYAITSKNFEQSDEMLLICRVIYTLSSYSVLAFISFFGSLIALICFFFNRRDVSFFAAIIGEDFENLVIFISEVISRNLLY